MSPKLHVLYVCAKTFWHGFFHSKDQSFLTCGVQRVFMLSLFRNFLAAFSKLCTASNDKKSNQRGDKGLDGKQSIDCWILHYIPPRYRFCTANARKTGCQVPLPRRKALPHHVIPELLGQGLDEILGPRIRSREGLGATVAVSLWNSDGALGNLPGFANGLP